jgi:hypothetical protein
VARRPGFNPFYVLLVIAGIAFAITACAYGVMTFAELRAGVSPAARSALLEYLEAHGAATMAAELAVLAVATVGAIGTDRMWQRRGERQHHHLPASRPADDGLDTDDRAD